MGSIVKTCDAIACLLNKYVEDEQNGVTSLRKDPFAQMAAVPTLQRIKSRELQCYVEPLNRIINESENQDACSDEWQNQIGIVIVQKVDDIGNDENQPGNISEIRGLICLVEKIGNKFVEDWTRIELCDKSIARLVKSETEQELFNREWLKDHHVFYSQLILNYG